MQERLAERYETSLAGVDWSELRATLIADAFDNGRSPEELRRSFEQSFATVVAYAQDRIIGTARALSDGACNAYVVDVWTFTPYRRRGIARAMMKALESKLEGQHVALFTSEAVAFYKAIGFSEEPVGLTKVVGKWLQRHA